MSYIHDFLVSFGLVHEKMHDISPTFVGLSLTMLCLLSVQMKRSREDMNRRNPKGDAGKGTGKNVTTICVKIHTVGPDLTVAKELLREERTKCRAYGQRDGYNLQALERGMTPVVLEQFGRTAPGAQAIFNRIINHRLQILVRQGIPFSFAKRTASSELWGPISCTLLRAAWQAHAECAPRVGLANLGTTTCSLPNSPGESQ